MGSEGEAKWETWSSGSGFSCCLYDNCRKKCKYKNHGDKGSGTLHQSSYLSLGVTGEAAQMGSLLWEHDSD